MCLGGNPGGSLDLSPRQEGKRLGGAASTWALLQVLSIAALCLLVREIVFEPSSDLVTSHWLPKLAIEDSSLIKPQLPSAVCPPAAFTLPSHSAVAQRVFLLGTGCVRSPHSFYKVHTPDFSTLPTLSLAKKW